MENKTDIYDVKQYTERELYSILNVSSPTDRELEAKIHFFINKYERVLSDEGNKLVRFFQDIYGHFFELEEEDESTEPVMEGFDVSFSGFTKGTDVSNVFYGSPNDTTIKRDAPIDPNDPTQKAGINRDISFSIASAPGTKDTKQTSQIGLVKSLDYSKGSINPLLKQTIKRIICVDSQFRDKKTYPYSSDYTFNLSDTMTDVVSLKLYSVQIPYTWYTINNSYGSNFFFIKGNAPGIDTGNSDYQFKINPGSYTAPNLVDALKTSISEMQKTTTDISFGTTSIEYDSNGSKSSIQLDLKKTFLDIDFEMYFPSWTSPKITNPNLPNNRFLSIPGYLGYNKQICRSYNIYSYNVLDNTISYVLNPDNNYFTVSIYNGPIVYDVSNIITSRKYNLNNTGSFIRTTIINQIKYAFETQHADINGSITYDNTNNFININITLDRTKIAYVENMKAAIIFPNDTNIWIGPTSCFQFDISVNELNNIISEIDTPITLRTITNNPWIYLKCNREYYGNEGIKTYYANDVSYINNQITRNTTHILSDSSYVTTMDNTFTIIGDEYTKFNQCLYVQTGNIDLSGSKYNVYGPNIYVSNTNNTIPAIITGNTIVNGNTAFNTIVPFTISGERYLYNGNATIQGNTTIIGKGNITNSNSTYYEINSNNTYQVCGISGNSNVLGKLTTGANISIFTNNNVRLNGTKYKISGDAFITGNTEFINGSTHVIPNGNCLISGNYSFSGNTYLRNGIISISSGNIQITVPPTESISSYKISGYTTAIYNLDNFSEYTGTNAISGNIYITGSNYAIETSGNVIINTSDPSNSLLPIYDNTWFNGNTTVYGDTIIVGKPSNVSSITYKMSGASYKIIQSGNISGNTSIINGNINIINDQSINIIGTSYTVKGNINNAIGNIVVTNPSNIYGNILVIGESYVLNGNTDITGFVNGIGSGGNINIYGNNISGKTYNIDSSALYFLNKTNVFGNVYVGSGNLTIQSDMSYNINGNTYSLINHNQAVLSGNIFNLSGHSIIQGNHYSVSPITGNIQVYNDISVNDYVIDISNETTTNLTEYINNIQVNINQQIELFKTNQAFDGNISLTIDNSANPLLSFKYNKKVSTNNYSIDLSHFYEFNNVALNDVSLDDISNIIMTSGTNIISGNFVVNASYNIDTTNNKIKINPTGSVNQFVPSFDLILEPKLYTASIDFQNDIKTMFNTNTNKYNINFSGTDIIMKIDSITNTIQFVLTININSELTQDDYTLYLYNLDIVNTQQSDIKIPKFYNYINNTKWTYSSTNSWNKELGFFENRYILIDYTVNNALQGKSSYVYGTTSLLNNTITLDNLNNYFYIRPISKLDGIAVDSSGNAPNIIKIELTPDTYSKESLTIAINNAFSSNNIVKGSELSFITYNNKTYSNIRLNINKTFTTKDFKLVFYDLYSFVYCNIGVSGKSSLRNGTWDSTLGWILGFRVDTIYPLSSYVNSNTNIAKMTGDTCMSVYLYNYFMIILDDYVQNHLNDGLVTITTADTGISLPSYANPTTLKCNPVTNQITTLSSGLTANQIYSANQLLNNKLTSQKKYASAGPFVQDIFGLIPIKVSGMSVGQPFIEYGGSLQLQERTYFGPVNIRRMRIQLINDKGDMVDLNGADWSFSLVCEQLYSNAFSNSNTK
jgi:hypothetical protein